MRVATAILQGSLFAEVRSRRNLTYAVEARFRDRAPSTDGIWIDLDDDAPGHQDRSTAYVCLPDSATVDLAAEFGLGLNDDSPNYLGAGLSFYIR